MTDTKIETGIRYVGEALAAIVRQLMSGDRVKAEFGPDLIIEGLVMTGTYTGGLHVGGRVIWHEAGRSHSRPTALTVLSLAPRPDPEPWWAGAEAVMDKSCAVWELADDGAYHAWDADPDTLAAASLEANWGPCKPIQQDGRTILSEAEIGAVIAEVALRGRTVGHVLLDLHGWRKEEK